MFATELESRLVEHLSHITVPVQLVTTLGGPKSELVAGLVEQLAELSALVTVTHAEHLRRPSFAVHRVGTDIGVRFAGVPLGHQFSSLVLALVQVGGHPPRVPPELADRIRSLEGTYDFETYFALSCRSCPPVVQALNTMSVLNPSVRHTAVNGASFPEEASAREVVAVPNVFLDGEPFAQGRMTLEQILDRLT